MKRSLLLTSLLFSGCVLITSFLKRECGDGFLDIDEGDPLQSEECDDGNNKDADGCESGCTLSCGNGIVDPNPGENCDDGNNLPQDGCDELCHLEFCGDGVVQPIFGEQCDDGNTQGGDGCRADCIGTENCGDFVLDEAAGETCDDGNPFDGDGCSADCLDEDGTSICGNFIVEVGEECEDFFSFCSDGSTFCFAEQDCLDAGAAGPCLPVSGDGCSSVCAFEFCGDGIVNFNIFTGAQDVCDDGNNVSGDGCRADCSGLGICGDGVLDADLGEECEDNNTNSGDGCDSDCRDEVPGSVCGNSIFELGEQCEDGNTLDNDGCSSACVVEFCGDGIVNFDVSQGVVEVCDGNFLGQDSCRFDCLGFEICGNNLLDFNETCEDGNSVDGDGCSACVDDDGVPDCGNVILELGESCDDGNLIDGDGCSFFCQFES